MCRNTFKYWKMSWFFLGDISPRVWYLDISRYYHVGDIIAEHRPDIWLFFQRFNAMFREKSLVTFSVDRYWLKCVFFVFVLFLIWLPSERGFELRLTLQLRRARVSSFNFPFEFASRQEEPSI